MQNRSERTTSALFVVSLLAVTAAIGSHFWHSVIYVSPDGQPFEPVEPLLLELAFDEQGRPLRTIAARPCPPDWLPGHKHPRYLDLQTTRTAKECPRSDRPRRRCTCHRQLPRAAQPRP